MTFNCGRMGILSQGLPSICGLEGERELKDMAPVFRPGAVSAEAVVEINVISLHGLYQGSLVKWTASFYRVVGPDWLFGFQSNSGWDWNI
jgi:hypothetical protein